MTSKLFRSIATAAFVFGCAVAIPSLAAAQTSATPASLAGTWNMGLIGDHVIPTALVLEQDGAALKGTFILMGKDFPVTGEVHDGKFTLTGKGPALGRSNPNNNGDHAAGAAAAAPVKAAGPERPSATAVLADMTITGATDGNGGLAGEMVSKMGERSGTIKWTAERLKERTVPTEQAASTASLDMTGKWTMQIVEAQIEIVLDLKQTGSKVTGIASSDHLGVMQLEGTVANGSLTFSTAGSAGGQDIKIEYSGKFKADGTFAGDLTSQMGSMTWTLARAKK
jgi:hypothetical protein